MKNSKRLLAASIAAACSTLPVAAFATNGDELIGLGAQSRALGGTGTAAFFGSENALTNPALLGKSKGTEFAFGGTLFMPDVKSETDFSSPGTASSKTSDADQNVIPEVSMSTRINDNLTFGIGMYGTAGMGVDYRGSDGLIHAYTNLQLMKFVPALAYNKDNFGFGFAPVLQYGALDINYRSDADMDGDVDTIGNGVSTDLGTGFNLGMYYDVNSQLTVALAYQSAIDMEYKDQLTGAADGFWVGPNQNMTGTATIGSNKLEQPAQIKAGVAYTMNEWMFTVDYKQIKWGSANGYKTFNWKDQDVYGLGAKYTGNGYWVGFGYNHGEDPIKVLPSTSYENQVVNMFNNHLFPGIVEDHFTFGGGYAISKNMTLEGAVVIADEVTKQVETGFISAQPTPDASYQKTTHSQTSYTISLRTNF